MYCWVLCWGRGLTISVNDGMSNQLRGMHIIMYIYTLVGDLKVNYSKVFCNEFKLNAHSFVVSYLPHQDMSLARSVF